MIADPGQGLGLLALFMVGFLGAGHCVGMCGGIATALGFASQGKKGLGLVLGYNGGRIISYAIAGCLVALLGYWGRNYLLLGPWLRVVAGVLLILMGLYLGDWWRILLSLEKVGSALWQKIQPLGKGLLPVETVRQSVLLGMLWGWLPCGLVYTALAYAATAENPAQGALLMVAFGLGTAPAMIAGGIFSERLKSLLQGLWLRRVMALIMIGFGVWTLFSVTQHSHHLSSDTNTDENHMQHHH